MHELTTARSMGLDEGGIVIRVAGDIDMASSPDLQTALVGADTGVVCIDLGGVSFMDSTGVRAIVETAERLTGSGCVILHAAPPAVVRLLQILGFDGAVPNLHLLDGAEGCSPGM